MKMSYNKYHAQKCVIGGEVFDSKKEAHRYQELKILERAGEISDLKRQVKYVLIPSQREFGWKSGIAKHGKVIERECSYVADFVYIDNRTQEKVVEDVKGVRTEVYRLKKKMMLYFHGIRIREV